jgi:hypothetical protein
MSFHGVIYTKKSDLVNVILAKLYMYISDIYFTMYVNDPSFVICFKYYQNMSVELECTFLMYFNTIYCKTAEL